MTRPARHARKRRDEPSRNERIHALDEVLATIARDYAPAALAAHRTDAICWLDAAPLDPAGRVTHTVRTVRARMIDA